jgi:DNA-binding PadR family transcriptional regulator
MREEKRRGLAPPTLSQKEELVLQLLTGVGEMYGLELVEAADGKLRRGTVYVTLQRMADKGFVESRQEDAPEGAGGLPRRYFKATGFGAKVLSAKTAYDMALMGGEVWV